MKTNKPQDNPSGGNYTINDPVTGILCAATTFEGLIHRVGAVRTAIGAKHATGLNLRDELEKLVCEKYPEDCVEVDMTIPRKRKLTLSDVLHGTRVLASFVAGGAKPVSIQEHDRRAKICISCPYNIRFPTPCTGVCGELLSIMYKLSGGVGTEFDRSLHSCSICGCYNAAQTWVPMEHLRKGVTDDMVKQFQAVEHCWKHF